MTIFDFVLSDNIVSYYETMNKDREPYFAETLFPNEKQLGMKIEWIKGSAGLPVVLRTSALDAKAIPRGRVGFDKMEASLPFFKESMYIDENLRQKLNDAMMMGNQVLIDMVVNKIFADTVRLIESAAVSRERMRMMALTTGIITLASNGQAYTFDYDMPSGNKKTVTVSWSDPSANIIADIIDLCDKIEDETGVRPTRAVCDRKTFRNIMANDTIKKSIYVLTNGVGGITQSNVMSHIFDQTGVTISINTKRYIDETGNVAPYMPEDTFVLFPDGELGNTYFGTTPEESDLLTGNVSNVTITDTGVAVTTMKIPDPVTVETKVTMLCLPSFPMVDKVGVIDTNAD